MNCCSLSQKGKYNKSNQQYSWDSLFFNKSTTLKSLTANPIRNAMWEKKKGKVWPKREADFYKRELKRRLRRAANTFTCKPLWANQFPNDWTRKKKKRKKKMTSCTNNTVHCQLICCSNTCHITNTHNYYQKLTMNMLKAFFLLRSWLSTFMLQNQFLNPCSKQ